LRILILDDASPDRTPEVAAGLVERDSRIEYRRHAVNKRHIDTYNEGLLEWASGDYVLLLSADDMLAPGALERAAAVMQTNPSVSLVHGQQLTMTDAAPQIEPVSAQTQQSVDILRGEEFIESCCQAGDNPVATPTAIVRTSVQHEIGGYRKSLPHSADMEMWLRCAARGAIARVNAVQAYKRMHQSNMQYQYLGGGLGDLKERQAAFDSFFREDGYLLRDRDRLAALANRSLGLQAFWAAHRAFEAGDHAACESCLADASRIDPDLPSTPEYGRFRWKRRLGCKGWSLLQRLIGGFRRKSLTPAF
jgi:glycosyltransferase involved in cell wall biosynthesis